MTFIVLLNALFGISMPISKVLLVHASPLFLTGVRMAAAGFFLLLYEKWWHKRSMQFQRGDFFILFQISLLGIFASYVLRFYALQYLPAGKASFLQNFSPLISSVFAYLFFNERITKRQWIGLFFGFVGMIPILISSSKEEAFLSEHFFISVPEFLIIVSATLYSYSIILVQKLVRDKQYSPATVNGVTMGIGGMLALCVSFFVEQNSVAALTMDFCLMLSFLIFTSNIVCHTLHAMLLRTYSATFLSFSGFLSPLFSVFYGWSFLQETVTWHFYVSSIIVLVGLYLFYKDEQSTNSKKVYVETV